MGYRADRSSTLFRLVLAFVVAACLMGLAFPSGYVRSDSPLPRLSHAEKRWLEQNRTVSVYLPQNHAPFLMLEDGRPAGLAWEYLATALKRLGLRPEPYSAPSLQQAVAAMEHSGGPDITTLFHPESIRPDGLLHTGSYYAFPVVTLTRRDHPSPETALQAKGAVIGVSAEADLSEWASAQAPDHGDIRLYPDVASALLALQAGEVQACVADLASARRAMLSSDFTQNMVASSTPAQHVHIAYGVSSDLPRLASALTKALETLPPELSARLHAQWIHTTADSGVQHRFVWGALGFAALILAILAGVVMSNRKLRREIAARKEAQSALRISEKRYRDIFENAQVGIFRTALSDGSFLEANKRLANMFDFDNPEDFKREFVASQHYIDSSAREQMLEVLLRDGEIRNFQCRLTTRTDRQAWFEYSARLDEDSLWGVAEEITERKAVEQALEESETKYRTLFENAADAIVIHDMEGHILDVNGAACTFLDCRRDDLQEQGLDPTCTQNQLQIGETEVRRLREKGELFHEMTRADTMGQTQHLEINSRLVDYMGRQAVLSMVRDVTDRKRLETELLRLARTDSLTGVYNRHRFLERAARELRRARRYGSQLSVIMLDIDFFKKINDIHGHHAGDQVLRILAGACRDSLRESDFIGRLGGEEFGVVLPQTGQHGAHHVAERIRNMVDEMDFVVDGSSLSVTVSVGVTSSISHHPPLDELLRLADRALYMAKEAGRNRTCAT